MKKLLFAALMLITLNVSAQGKVYNLDAKKDTTNHRSPAKLNGDLAIYNGQQYLVYESVHGSKFIIVTSKKSGKQYRKYIK